MKSLIITAPILPGKLDGWRACVDALVGARRQQYHEAMREGGLTRLRVWHQKSPDGTDMAVVLYEGPEVERFLARVATGTDDFSTWFRGELEKAHGMDLSKPPPPPPELAIDEQLPEAATWSCSRVRVEDYRAWRRVMDDLAPLRAEHGQVSEQILHSSEDAHEVTVLLGWASEERARRYYAHPELSAAVERAGGVDGRGLAFLVPDGGQA